MVFAGSLWVLVLRGEDFVQHGFRVFGGGHVVGADAAGRCGDRAVRCHRDTFADLYAAEPRCRSHGQHIGRASASPLLLAPGDTRAMVASISSSGLLFAQRSAPAGSAPSGKGQRFSRSQGPLYAERRSGTAFPQPPSREHRRSSDTRPCPTRPVHQDSPPAMSSRCGES